mmetsp:Transcript_33048/g.95681  ORF Transcript_33048/g.95681 Transcript_33048/m.95681 type:complete len:200 (-) Transcript_33048:117-716(-)
MLGRQVEIQRWPLLRGLGDHIQGTSFDSQHVGTSLHGCGPENQGHLEEVRKRDGPRCVRRPLAASGEHVQSVAGVGCVRRRHHEGNVAPLVPDTAVQDHGLVLHVHHGDPRIGVIRRQHDPTGCGTWLRPKKYELYQVLGRASRWNHSLPGENSCHVVVRVAERHTIQGNRVVARVEERNGNRTVLLGGSENPKVQLLW